MPGSTLSRPLWVQIGCIVLDMFLECQNTGQNGIYLTGNQLLVKDQEDVQGETGRNVFWRIREDFQEKQTLDIQLDKAKEYPTSTHWREMIPYMQEFLGAGHPND